MQQVWIDLLNFERILGALKRRYFVMTQLLGPDLSSFPTSIAFRPSRIWTIFSLIPKDQPFYHLAERTVAVEVCLRSNGWLTILVHIDPLKGYHSCHYETQFTVFLATTSIGDKSRRTYRVSVAGSVAGPLERP